MCIRVGPARLVVQAMALAGGTTVSDVVRTLMAEALAARRAGCAHRHRGPVTAGVCAHCGGDA